MKQITSVAFYLFLLIPTVQAANNSHKEEDFSKRLYTAWSSQQAMPLFSTHLSNASEQQAYSVQTNFVEHILNHQTHYKIAGFKAGLTSIGGQQRFKTTGPVYGVLFEHSLVDNSKSIKRSLATRLMLETELGFILNRAISEPLSSTEQLIPTIKSVVPVIELPDLAFDDISKINGQDIIATNVASHQIIVGSPLEITLDHSLNEIDTKLYYNLSDTPIISGKGSDASGNQLTALLELINHQLKSGHKNRPGQLFITGALGKMIPARAGKYRATFGTLGQISFEIVE